MSSAESSSSRPSADPFALLLPRPRHAKRTSGRHRLRAGTPIVLGPGARSDLDLHTAQVLREGIHERCGLDLCIESHDRTADLGPRLELRRGHAEGPDRDAYTLRVEPDQIVAEAQGAPGLRYAVQTLLQLLPRARRRVDLPACEIDDAPDLEHRGLMLDVSRGKVPTSSTLRDLVDLCAALKLNVLMLYVEHTFHFRRHPEIGAGSSPLDAQTLRELDAYAARNCVELVPSLQSLGHMERILALPEHRALAETSMGWTITPVDPDTYTLLGELYDEFLPNFRSRSFNANCDEPWDLGRGRSAKRSHELGPGGVYLEHVDRVRDLAERHGKRTMIWGDVVHAHPERIGEIAPDLVLLDWWYEAQLDYDRVAAFAEHGLEFWVCPGTSSWNCLFPRVENSWQNTARWADAARRHGARGLLTTDWGDFGHYNLQGNSWLAFAWAAQQSWSGDMQKSRFDRAFSRQVFDADGAEPGRLYRALGSIHDPGFTIFNGSAIQYLYFDDPERSYFISASRPAALARCEKALAKVRERIEKARPQFRREATTWQELAYAADASLLAIHKARAGLDYNAWRREPDAWRAADRRGLARTLRAIADEQTALTRTLRRLWMARSEPSNFAMTQTRLRQSIAALRAAARRLETNRPSPPPPEHEGFRGPDVLAAIRDSLGQ